MQIETCPHCGSDLIENDGDAYICFDCLMSGTPEEIITIEVEDDAD